MLENLLRYTRLDKYAAQLEELSTAVMTAKAHGKWPEWMQIIKDLPQLDSAKICLDCAAVTVGDKKTINKAEYNLIYLNLIKLHPWRKGPFNLYGITIDSEWCSNLKWDRLISHIAPLNNRLVLDVGCGNGYYLWRMLGAGARIAIGVDPGQLCLAQFYAVKHFFQRAPTALLPLKSEDLPDLAGQGFDTVFSMGVLYHRRSPINHLQELWCLLIKGGQLVLETLVVEGDQHTVLVPAQRYAKMDNIWFLPSVPQLMIWCAKVGFKNIRIINESETTTKEQRTTKWMKFESLADFLNPKDNHFTIEGYPSPRRAILLAER